MEKIAEVSQSRPQEQTDVFLVTVSVSEAHCGADSGIRRAHRGGVSGSDAGARQQAHRGPELHKKYRRRFLEAPMSTGARRG